MIDKPARAKQSGILHEWGAFPAEGKGYCNVEGTNVDAMKMAKKHVPVVGFKAYPVATIFQIDELTVHLTG